MATPKVSIALVGDSFYLCGPKGNNLAQAATPGFQGIFAHSQSYVHHTFVALGEDDSYFISYIDERTGKSYNTYSLSAYPDLDKHIRDNGTSGIVCLSLGEDGSYFFRNDGGSAWKLPQSVTDHAGLRSKDDDPVEFLFLGKDDAYYAETRGGSTRWNFKGNYGSLNATIRHSTSGVRCLGMNLQDDRSYFLLFKDGDTQCNPGTSGLTQQSFSTWAARFRTLL